MLKGKKVWLEDIGRLRVIYPSYKIYTCVPLICDDGIYNTKENPIVTNPNAIWITRQAEYNLDHVPTLRNVIGNYRHVPKKYDFVWNMSIDDIWNFLQEFMFLGYSVTYTEEIQSSIFKLFKSLSGPNFDIYAAYKAIPANQEVILSSLLTMFHKMQNIEQYKGLVSVVYLMQLDRMHKILVNIRAKLVAYMLSYRTETDMLHLLFNLRR